MNKSYANVKTALPGPKAKELLKRRHDIVPDAVSYGVPTFVDKADGAILQDVDGNRFIDLAGAIGTINAGQDRKSTRLNSSHVAISYAVFCLKKKNKKEAK